MHPNHQLTSTDVLIIFFIIVVLVAIVLTPFIISVFKLRDMPEQHVQAIAFAKGIPPRTGFNGKFVYRYTVYFIAFEFPDGSKKEFQVSQEVFKTINENDVGILTYKERNNRFIFVGFEKE